MTELIEREQPTRLFRIPVADWDELPRDRRVTLEEFTTSDEPIAGLVSLSIDQEDVKELDRKDRQFLKSYDCTPGVEFITELLRRGGELLWFRAPSVAMDTALSDQVQTQLYMWCAFEDQDHGLTYAIPRPTFDKFETFVQQWLQHYSINAPQVTSKNTIDISPSARTGLSTAEQAALVETLAAMALELQEMQVRLSTIEMQMQQHKHTGSGGVTTTANL